MLLCETFSQKIKNNEVKKGSVIYTLGKLDSVSFHNSFLIVSFGFGFPWCSRYKLGVSFILSCICRWCMCMCMLVCCLTVQFRLPFTSLFLSLASAVLTGVCHHSPLAVIFIFDIFNFAYVSVCMYLGVQVPSEARGVRSPWS